MAEASLFTVGASGISFNQNGIVGTINPVYSASGTVANYNGGVPDFTKDFFIFDLTITSGSLDGLSFTLPPMILVMGNPVTTGYFADAGQAPNGTPTGWVEEIRNTAKCNGIPGSCPGLSEFSFNLDGVAAGSQGVPAGYVEGASTETTVRLFAIFSTATSLQSGNTVSFMLSPVGGADFTVQGQIIPEPGTILLLGSGLMALGLGERRRRKQLGN